MPLLGVFFFWWVGRCYWIWKCGLQKNYNESNRVIKELNGNPPDFILTSDNQGPYGIFDELKKSLTQDYTMLGKFEIGGKIINLFENKSIR